MSSVTPHSDWPYPTVLAQQSCYGRVWFPSGYRLARLSGGRLSRASSEPAMLWRNEVQARFPGARLSADFCTGRHESDGDASNQSPISCMRRAWLAVLQPTNHSSGACAEPGQAAYKQANTPLAHPNGAKIGSNLSFLWIKKGKSPPFHWISFGR